MDETDGAAWQRMLDGDARAFGVVWDRHHDRVFRHLCAIGQDAADAEDLTAAAFLELWRRRTAVRFVDGSVLPWLVVTARNVARNADRARRRYRRFLAALPATESAADPADLIADRDDERLVHLRAELARARTADADLLALTAVEGYSLREAAAALGLSESAAKMRLSRLRARITATLPAPLAEGH